MEIFHRLDAKRRAERAARKIAPISNQIDAIGRDREDYCQMFLIKIWQSGKKFNPEKNAKNNLKAWTNVSLRNLSMSFRRDLAKIPNRQWFDCDELVDRSPSAFYTLANKQLIRSLKSSIDSNDWKFLMQYLACDCKISELWRDLGKPVTQAAVLKKCKIIKYRARKKLIKNDKIMVSKLEEWAS